MVKMVVYSHFPNTTTATLELNCIHTVFYEIRVAEYFRVYLNAKSHFLPFSAPATWKGFYFHLCCYSFWSERERGP